MTEEYGAIKVAVREMLLAIGEDVEREGLQGTPERVARMWTDFSRRRAFNLTTFSNEGMDEMVIVRRIRFYSLCEHHMLPYFGEACVAYIPDRVIIGLSKIPRLVHYYAQRLSIQERLTNQVADALVRALDPVGVGVLMRAHHMCMSMRGVCEPDHETVTTALRGVFLETPTVKAEFLANA